MQKKDWRLDVQIAVKEREMSYCVTGTQKCDTAVDVSVLNTVYKLAENIIRPIKADY